MHKSSATPDSIKEAIKNHWEESTKYGSELNKELKEKQDLQDKYILRLEALNKEQEQYIYEEVLYLVQ